jgi:hypothetical protein
MPTAGRPVWVKMTRAWERSVRQPESRQAERQPVSVRREFGFKLGISGLTF